MKNIVNLVLDIFMGGSCKWRCGGDDDDFGVDDVDWGVYWLVVIGVNKGDFDDDEEGEEDLEVVVRVLEVDLLEYDKDFIYENMFEV